MAIRTSQVLSLVKVVDGEKGESGINYKLVIERDASLRFYGSDGNDIWSPGTLTFQLLNGDLTPMDWSGVTDEKTVVININASAVLQSAANEEPQFVQISFDIDGARFNDEVDDTPFWHVFSLQSSIQNENTQVKDILNININEWASYSQVTAQDGALLTDIGIIEAAPLLYYSNLNLLITAYVTHSSGDLYSVSGGASVRPGLNSEMASFAINAHNISAAVGSNKLIFDSDGLTIQNGGFRIKNADQLDVLYADNDGNLVLEGFIIATGGSIGGFSIEGGQLTSKKKQENGEPYIVLDGELGVLKAMGLDIVLGEVSGSLSVGQLNLRAPLNGDNRIMFTENGYFSLMNDGTLTIKNATVQGVLTASELQSITFTENNVSTVDGAILFLPKIEYTLVGTSNDEANGVILIEIQCESADSYQIGDAVYLSGDGQTYYGQIHSILDDIITISTPQVSGLNFHTVYAAGAAPVIGINGGNSDMLGGSLKKKSISIFSPSTQSPHLVLGMLPKALYEDEDVRYGLYCDDVILNGSIHAETVKDEDTVISAGINTRGIDENDVIIWAGEVINKDGSRHQPPFRVTRKGSVYAADITLENGVLSNSTIYGGVIKTAEIRGWKDDNDAPLKIYSLNAEDKNGELKAGIGFYNEKQDGDELVFTISSNSFNAANGNPFISIDQDGIKFIGQQFTTGQMIVRDNHIIYENTAIELSNNTLRLYQMDSEETIFSSDISNANLNSDTVHIKSKLELGKRMFYRNAGGNYKLYVYDND